MGLKALRITWKCEKEKRGGDDDAFAQLRTMFFDEYDSAKASYEKMDEQDKKGFAEALGEDNIEAFLDGPDMFEIQVLNNMDKGEYEPYLTTILAFLDSV